MASPTIASTQGSRRDVMKTATIKPNLRNQQRVDASLDVTFRREDAVEVRCRTTNLSRAGMMISCSSDCVEKLVPGLKSPAPGQWVEASAEFALPVVAAQKVSILAHCHIIYLRRVSRNEFQLGIQFSEVEGRGHEYIDQYVSRQLSSLT